MLTFGAGPRGCLGRGFALTESKATRSDLEISRNAHDVFSPLQAVLSVLIRNYTFELPDGRSTEFDYHRSFVDRPKVAGQDGPRVPMIIRRAES